MAHGLENLVLMALLGKGQSFGYFMLDKIYLALEVGFRLAEHCLCLTDLKSQTPVVQCNVDIIIAPPLHPSHHHSSARLIEIDLSAQTPLYLSFVSTRTQYCLR